MDDDAASGGLQQAADELYALPPDRFTTARDEAAKRARAGGDRRMAGAIAALRRPSISAWLVNLIAIRRPQVLAELLELGRALQGAQAEGDAGSVRQLSRSRRLHLDELRTLAGQLADDSGGPKPSRAHLSEFESTLVAALADPQAAALVRSGRVLKPLTYSGFGPSDAAAATNVAVAHRFGAGGRQSGVAAGIDRAAADQAGGDTGTTVAATTVAGTTVAGTAVAGTAVAAAHRRLAEAQLRLEEADLAHAQAQEQVSQLGEQLTQLQQLLAQAQQAVRLAREARLAAQREVAASRRRMGMP